MKIIDIYIGRPADSGNCIASQELSREGSNVCVIGECLHEQQRDVSMISFIII